MRKLFLLLLLMTAPVWAQNRYDGIAIGPRGPVPDALIAVCTQPATTTTAPCSPLATLYTNSSLSTTAPNPLSADALGNFHFYAASNSYTVQIYGPQINPATVMSDQTLAISNPSSNIAGVFTNTQYNPAIISTVNHLSGSCPTYVLDLGGSGSYATDALTGCVIVPSTSTVTSSNAVAGYIIGQSPSTGCGASGTCTVAGYFSAQAGANGVLLWGINPACNDQSALGSFTSVNCQNEFDQNISSSTTVAKGAAFTGHAAVSDTNTVAVDVEPGTGAFPVWYTGFQCDQGAVGSNTCLAMYPISNSNNVDSQNIAFTAKSSGGSPLTGALLLNPSGNFQYLPPTGSSDYFLTNNGGLQLGAATGGAIQLVPPSTANVDTFNFPDTAGTSTTVCTTTVVAGGCSSLSASLTTTAATTDNVTITGMTASGHCSMAATNASAATNLTTTYISAKTTNQITVTHTATASMTYDILCTPN